MKQMKYLQNCFFWIVLLKLLFSSISKHRHQLFWNADNFAKFTNGELRPSELSVRIPTEALACTLDEELELDRKK